MPYKSIPQKCFLDVFFSTIFLLIYKKLNFKPFDSPAKVFCYTNKNLLTVRVRMKLNGNKVSCSSMFYFIELGFSEVNFINILRAHFAPIFWRQKLQSCVLSLTFFGSSMFYFIELDFSGGHMSISSTFFLPFLYESVFCSFSLVTVWLCNFLAKDYQRKSCS